MTELEAMVQGARAQAAAALDAMCAEAIRDAKSRRDASEYVDQIQLPTLGEVLIFGPVAKGQTYLSAFVQYAENLDHPVEREPFKSSIAEP